MRSQARLFALRAAAKVVLVLPLSACGEHADAPGSDGASVDGPVDGTSDGALACGLSGSGFEHGDAQAEVSLADAPVRDGATDATDATDADGFAPPSDADAAADVFADVGVDAARADAGVAAEVGTPEVISRATFACCADLLNAALPADASFASFFTPAHADDPSIDACCRAVIAQLDAEHDPDPGREYDDYTLAGSRGGVEACCLRLHASWSETCNPTISGGPLAPAPMPPAVARHAAVTPLDLRAEGRRTARSLVLTPAIEGHAIEDWQRRMVEEHTSARVFDALAAQLLEAGFDAGDAEASRRFAVEERRHGVLCAAVVEALGGVAYAAPEPLPEVPRHEDVDAREAALRNVIGICCVSETLAVASIAAERHAMPAGAVRALVTSIWSDEIGHARFGWRLLARALPGVGAEARGRLAAYARIAIAHAVAHEERPRQPGSACERLAGVGREATARTLTRDVVEQVLAPAFAALGLGADTRALRALRPPTRCAPRARRARRDPPGSSGGGSGPEST